MGCYFIFQGNVIQKYNLKKKAFTEEVEDVSELPTIMTEVVHKEKRSLTYGDDFSITFGILNSTTYNLSYGINEMAGLPSLRFEKISSRCSGVGTMEGFLIVPLSFPSSKENMTFQLSWAFKNTSDFLSKVISIGMFLSTENNSIPCITGKCDGPGYNDGSVVEFLLKPGQIGYCYIYAEKYIFLQELHKCRTQPYNQEVLHLSLEEMKTNCSFPCRPNMTNGRMLDEVIRHLPYCRSSREVDCFDDAVARAKKAVLKEPCTKLQYRVDKTAFPNATNTNLAAFGLTFGSFYVAVKEQYVIYDLIAMIGAVGGTMGLCIGFSFNDAINFVLGYLEMGVNWTRARVANKRNFPEAVRKVKTLDQDSNNSTSQCKCRCTSSSADLEARLKALEESFISMRR